MTTQAEQLIRITGTITKASRRENIKRLVVQPESGKNFICDFDVPFEIPKPRKGQVVNVSGKFVSEGFATICLTNCVLVD